MENPVRNEDSIPPGATADDGETQPHSLSSCPPPPRSDGDLLWRLGGVLRTMRPHQWVKNVFVLAPVVFAKEVFEPGLLLRAGGAFGVFCLLAGAVYAMNDLADLEADRMHPVKRYRPIPSGRVPASWAKLLTVVLVVSALAGSLLLSVPFAIVALAYFAQNVAYSSKLKHVAYVDVAFIAAGFVLRVVAGGLATGTTVSTYLLACTALLAFFLGFGKRRHELTAATRTGKQRQALESYSKRGLDTALALTAVATVVVYLAYTLDARTRAFFHSNSLWMSTMFVVLGVARFLFIVRSRPRAESPTQEMLRDGPFVGVVLMWVVAVGWVVYQLHPGG